MRYFVGLFFVTIFIASQAQADDAVSRGRYLAILGDCAGCHTRAHGAAYAGGVSFPSPFGTIYSTNITPDPATGIGKWSEQEFYRAMHDGIRRDGKHLYPAFPYPWFTKVSREDVRAIKAFLDTLTPVRQENKPTELSWPLNVREVMTGWNELYFHEGAFKADPKKSEQWNRGAYLVNGPAHCAECHSPRNVLGAIIADKRFSGGPSPTMQGGVPSIRQDKLGKWTEQDIAGTLEDGMTPDADRVGAAMVDVVRNTSQLSAEDRAAMAAYIKTLSPLETAPR